MNTTETLEEMEMPVFKMMKDFFSSTEMRTGVGRDRISWTFSENSFDDIIRPVNPNRGGFYLQLPKSASSDRTKRYKDFCSMLHNVVDQLEKDLLVADKKAVEHNQKVRAAFEKEQAKK